MVVRTTAQRVRDILMLDYDCVRNPSLTGYIATASILVTRALECALRKGYTISEEEAELWERWLAAHAYAMSDQPYRARATLRASGQFQGETKMRLEATKYGQMALTLDPSGCLDNLMTKTRVRAFWLGKRPSEQTDAVNRE